jgi:hypothetical protein
MTEFLSGLYLQLCRNARLGCKATRSGDSKLFVFDFLSMISDIEPLPPHEVLLCKQTFLYASDLNKTTKSNRAVISIETPL